MRKVLYSPINGIVKSLDLVDYDVFSKRMLGDGVALIPSDNKILSPVDGFINIVYDTQQTINKTTSIGMDWNDYHITVVKQGYSFPKLKEKGELSIMFLLMGATFQNTISILFKRIMRSMYPIDKMRGKKDDKVRRN